MKKKTLLHGLKIEYFFETCNLRQLKCFFFPKFWRVTLILHQIPLHDPQLQCRKLPQERSNHLSWWDLGNRLLILSMQPNVTLKWFVVGCSAIFLTHCQLEFPRSPDYGEWNVPLNCYLPPPPPCLYSQSHSEPGVGHGVHLLGSYQVGSRKRGRSQGND